MSFTPLGLVLVIWHFRSFSTVYLLAFACDYGPKALWHGHVYSLPHCVGGTATLPLETDHTDEYWNCFSQQFMVVYLSLLCLRICQEMLVRLSCFSLCSPCFAFLAAGLPVCLASLFACHFNIQMIYDDLRSICVSCCAWPSCVCRL